MIYISAIAVPPVTPSEDGTTSVGTDGGETFIGGDNEDGTDEIDGGGGRDTIDGGRGSDRLIGGEGADIFRFSGKLFGKDFIKDYENIDEIKLTSFRGDAGRDILTGNGGADIFVVQKITATDLAAAGLGSKLSKFYDFIHDFELGKDRIGLAGFDKITELAVANDYDYSIARDKYFADVKARADSGSVNQLSVILDDLGYRLHKLRPVDEFKREEDGGKLFWTLTDTRGTKTVGRDDTALLMFRSASLSSDFYDNDNPFKDLDPSTLFEFL